MKLKTKTLLFICCICILFFNNANASPVSISTSKLVATNFYKIQSNSNNFNLYLAHIGKTQDSTIVYFAFNVVGNKGFVIVSADDVAKPILGYAKVGQFYLANAPEQVVKWIDFYASQIHYIKDNFLPQSAGTKREWNQYINPQVDQPSLEGIISNKIDPLLSTIWDQEPFYNDSCPKKSVTGCVATTMAQIMRYWSYPAKGKNITPSYYSSSIQYLVPIINLDSSKYIWNHMPYELDKSNSELAKLMYDCGVSVQMDYSPSGSGAWVITADNPICAQTSYAKYFRYDTTSLQGLKKSNFTTADWINILKNELSNGRPVQYAGFGFFGGHTWVCDGYDANDMFHMNWGWDGIDDGYYTLYNLFPSPVIVGVFNNQQEALVGISPPCDIADLKITNQNINKPNPVSGSTIKAFFTLWNLGKLASSGISTTKIYLSKNVIIDTTVATFLGQISSNSIPAYTHLDSISTNITIPATTISGKYYLFFYANANNNINECIEANNIAYVELDISSVQCNVPINDNCSGAILLNYNMDSCNSLVYSTSCGATPSGISYNDNTNDDDDVFFKFIPTESNATITVYSDSNYDAVFQVLESPCDSFLYPVYPALWYLPDCINQTKIGGVEKQYYKSLIPGKPYYVRVWHAKAGWGSGNFSICVYGNKCQLLKTPIPLLPGDTSTAGKIITTTVPIFSWHTDTSSYYKIKIFEEPYYGSSLVLEQFIYYTPNNTFQIPLNILKHNKKYCWTIESISDINATCSNVSEKLYFNIDTTFCPLPSFQASNIVFSNIQPNQVTLKWTKGNGSRTVVNGNSINSFRPPTYGTQKTANNHLNIFWGYDQEVYDGVNDSVIVYNLQPNSNYCFRLFAANCSETSSIYDTSFSNNNPLCTQTCDFPKQPTITSSKGTFIMCRGDSLILIAQSLNCYNCKYTWNTGDTGATIKVHSNDNSNYYGYTVTVDNHCTTSSNYITVIVEDSLKPIISGDNRICKGNGASLYVVNVNSSQVNYLWSNGSYSYSTNVSPIATTAYTVKTTNTCGSFISPPYTVIVDSLINLVDTIKGNSPALYNMAYHFIIDTVKNAYSYNWKTLNGHGATGNISTSYGPSVDIFWQPTSYTTDSVLLQVFNSCGASNIIYKSIILPPCTPPQTPIITSATGEFNICGFGSGLPIKAFVANCLGCNYSWTPYSYYGNGSSITVNPQNTTTYTVTVSNGCLPNTTASQQVTVFNNIENPNLSLTQTCKDSSILINAISTNAGSKSHYHWWKMVNDSWENIIVADTNQTLIVNQPVINGSQFRCLLKSSFTCGLVDTTAATITINCINNYDDSLKIIPNPNNGNFVISSKLNSAKTLSFDIYNSIGQKIYKSQQILSFGAKNLPVKIPYISSGVYFVVIWINSQKSVLPFSVIN